MEDSVESVADRLERAADRAANAGFHDSAAEMRASAAKLRMGASLDNAREVERKHLFEEKGPTDPVESIASRLERASSRMAKAGFRDTAEEMRTSAQKLRQGGSLEEALEAKRKFLPEEDLAGDDSGSAPKAPLRTVPRSSATHSMAGEYDPII